MKVLLQKDVPHLGKAGEVREVRPGYGRNFLIPQHLAVSVTAQAVSAHRTNEARIARISEEERVKEYELAGRLKRLTLEFREKATPEGKLYGGIHRESIVQALHQKGIMIETQSIILHEPLKTIGSHHIEIHIKFGVKTFVNISVTTA